MSPALREPCWHRPAAAETSATEATVTAATMREAGSTMSPPWLSPADFDWIVGGGLLLVVAVLVLLHRRAVARLVAARAEANGLNRRVDELRDRLEEVNRCQGRFVGNLAHEIKTPLTVALATAENLEHCRDDPAAVQAHAKRIVFDVRHLSELIDGFLRLARPFAQADTSHHTAVHVHDFVLEAVRRTQPLGKEQGVTIVTTLAAEEAPADDPEIHGDATLLVAMLENLLRNALRFSPTGGKVEVLVARHGRMVDCRVRDHGSGVDLGQLADMFDWFFRDAGMALKSAGTGFGLAIAKRIAEHHGGTITFQNLDSGGCEFVIALPILSPAGPAGATRHTPGTPSVSSPPPACDADVRRRRAGGRA